MAFVKKIWKEGCLFTLILSLILGTFLTPLTNTAKAEVASDFQAYVMAPLTKITDWNAFRNQLQTLKNNGVYALTTDVWWGDVEAAGDNQFDWSYYKTYANVVQESGLKWVPILSTHACGGNPGDDCNIPIPSWLWNKGSADEMKYKSETGYVNNEALSPFWSGIGQQYNDLYASFASNFSSYKGLIAKIYLSGGPSGELRFPSYYQAAGWSYPSRGKFQVYTDTAKNAFRTAMLSKYGSLNGVNQAWGLQLTNTSSINPPSDGDGFYSNGGYSTAYGKDFLAWYQSVLEKHLDTIASAAHANFDPVFGVRIGAKISGIHWQINNPAAPHSAEHAAGYYDYNTLIQKFKDNNIDLTFTALEMYDSGTSPAYSLPSTLVDTVSSIAKGKGVRLNGENALPTGNFQKIEEKILNWGYNGFTLLRLGNLVNSDGSPTGDLANFKKYVINHATPVVDPGGNNKVTIYYKKGYATPYLHYRPAGGTWTTAPGTKIPDAESAYPGYGKITVDIGSATQLEAAFNNGSGTWDSNNMKNYFFSVGTSTYTPAANGSAGTITAGAPAVDPGNGNTATIYYKKGYATPYIHYRTEGGTWTQVPGRPMPDAESSYPGYAKITLNLGTASRIEAAFNNGNGTWDSNNMKNYFFGKGTSTYTPNANGSAGAISPGVPGSVPDGGTSATDWSKQSIYFIMTDRFSNGDTSNDNWGGFASVKNDPAKWHGGDFQGIINQLDYIKDLGFTAIWITPVTAQKSVNAYHGYHTYDFYSIDGHLGTMDKLKELVNTAHSKQIAVMLDVVPNHTGDFQPGNGTAAAPFNNPDWYHHNGSITDADYDSNNQWKIENGDVAGLDDLNQENPATAQELKNWIKWLVQETKVDGLRVDTAKHMPKWFLKDFDTAAGTFTMGEIYDGNPSRIGDYSNYLDAVVDFPMYYTIRDVFGHDASTTKIKDRYSEDANYRDAKLNGVFLDNHDVKRFLNEASGKPGASYDKWPQLKAALGFVLTSRGIPIIYQGTELGYSGGADPQNREDIVPDANHELYKYIAKISAVRSSHPALQNGSQKEKLADGSFYGYQRSKDGDEVVVVINNSWNTATRTVSNIENISNGSTLKNQLGTDTVQIHNGSVNVTLGPKEVKILAKAG
ncbi:family 14 glycosylhydrolase [Paenibacillus tuaregi]|uniref:family 14 glycosylhydrolase n=1 Tax=Paenibacillus tuaregi TaxID=1816681 RepID=UPI0008390684|nr:family 14 glycosylhydrolase [Paenibacillus tuaregi]